METVLKVCNRTKGILQ